MTENTLQELQDKLAKFRYTESAEISDEELAVLNEMFSAKDAFKVLFKYMCVIESDKGTQLAYDIENLPTRADNWTAEEVADEIKFKQLLVRFVKMKMETLRLDFERKASDAVEAKEKEVLEEREKIEKEEKEAALEQGGVSPDM